MINITYAKGLHLFYLGDDYTVENLKASGFVPAIDEDDYEYVCEREILNNLTPGSRLSFTCLPASPSTEYKYENIIYLGNKKFVAIPYCTTSTPALYLKEIKKAYAETCISNLEILYKEEPLIAKNEYIGNLKRFMKYEIFI